MIDRHSKGFLLVFLKQVIAHFIKTYFLTEKQRASTQYDLTVNEKKLKSANELTLAAISISKRLLVYATLAGSSQVYALGLGDINAKAELGKSLQASITLIGNDVDIDDIQVRQLTLREAQQLGLSEIYQYFPLSVELKPNINSVEVYLQSKQIIREPFIEFAIELSWPNGNVYRVYTVLPETPNVSIETNLANNTTEIQRDKTANTGNNSSKINDTKNTENYSDFQDSYVVRPGDTVSLIARNWGRYTEKSSQSLTLRASQWLIENNPQAFINGDPSTLSVGTTLNLPKLEYFYPVDIHASGQKDVAGLTRRSIVETQAAKKIVSQENNNTDTAALNTSAIESRVRLSAKSEQDVYALIEDKDSRLNTNNSESTAERILRLQSQIDSAAEEIARLTRENDYYRQRIELIENGGMKELLERVLALQEQQIASLQQRATVDTSVSSEDAISVANNVQTESSSTLNRLNLPANNNGSVTESEQNQWYLSGWYFFAVASLVFMLSAILFLKRKRPTEIAQDNNSDAQNPIIEEISHSDIGINLANLENSTSITEEQKYTEQAERYVKNSPTSDTPHVNSNCIESKQTGDNTQTTPKNTFEKSSIANNTSFASNTFFADKTSEKMRAEKLSGNYNLGEIEAVSAEKLIPFHSEKFPADVFNDYDPLQKINVTRDFIKKQKLDEESRRKKANASTFKDNVVDTIDTNLDELEALLPEEELIINADSLPKNLMNLEEIDGPEFQLDQELLDELALAGQEAKPSSKDRQDLKEIKEIAELPADDNLTIKYLDDSDMIAEHLDCSESLQGLDDLDQLICSEKNAIRVEDKKANEFYSFGDDISPENDLLEIDGDSLSDKVKTALMKEIDFYLAINKRDKAQTLYELLLEQYQGDDIDQLGVRLLQFDQRFGS